MLPTENHVELGNFINGLYGQASGFERYPDGVQEKLKKEHVFLTYGEIEPKGIDDLIRIADFQDSDVVYDLGSGIGKAAMYFFLATPVRRVVGIEAWQSRHEIAVRMRDQLLQVRPQAFDAGRSLVYVAGNIKSTPLEGVTHAFLCATCFGETLLNAITRRFKVCPDLRWIFCFHPHNFHLPRLRVLEVEASWGISHCYVSTNRLPDGPRSEIFARV